MALLTQLDESSARKILLDYGLELASLSPLRAGSVNSNFVLETVDGGRYFARIYEEQGRDGAETELRLLEQLDQLGIPVALPRRQSNGSMLAEHAGKPFAVYPFIDGEILCQARVTPAACREVGRNLAKVHAAPVDLPGLGEGRFEFADLRLRLEQAEGTGRKDLLEAASRVRALMDSYGRRRTADLPRGVIHGDLFRDNVLFRGEKVAALLDFESASLGTFAYDLMVTLLAWCFGDDLDTNLARALVEAYHEVRPLESRELEALAVEGAAVCIRFATTRMTDFSMRVPEGEQPARAYQRFFSRLEALEAGVLDDVIRGLR